MKAHYTFSWKDVLKIMSSIQMIESNSLKRQSNVMKLFYHECLRTYGDRLLMTHDMLWFQNNLQEVCKKHFWVVEKLETFQVQKQETKSRHNVSDEHENQRQKFVEEIDPKRKDQFLWPIPDPNQLYYSLWNQEVEGFYMEVEKIDEIQKVIQGVLDRYNDSNERVRIDLMLFNQINRIMLKILRVITQPNGHLIMVALKGYGMKSAMKLVAFAANHQLRELEVYEGFQAEDWQGELRRSVIFCGNEDKHLTFYLDEYRMIKDSMYWDLECLLKNNVVSEITRKSDILLALANIYQQIEAEKKAQKFGLQIEEGKNEQLTSDQMKERDREQDEQQTEFISDNKRMMQKWPNIQAELYKIFLNRVKKNFHLVLQYSPSGTQFREKITKNKELMYHSQMIFFNDLPAPELESLAQSFFQIEKQKAENKAIIDGTGIPKIGQYSVSKDPDSQIRVQKSIVKLYLQAQEATKKYAEDSNQLLYMTPTMFLRVFNCYKKLLKERKVVVKDISARYDAGLDKIRQTQDAIYRYHQELERRSPILQEKQRSLMRVIHDIEEEFVRVKGQRDQLKRDEFEAESQTEQAKKIRDQCDDTLQKILPSLKEALESVSSLKKHEIAELRSMKKPPKVVKLVLQAVCMLLGVEPAWKKSKKTGRPKLSYWKAAQGAEVLGNPRLEQTLVAFDRNKVTPETMMEVEEVLTSNNYSHEKARSASIAATGLFKWVQSTREYFYIFKEIEPSRDAFMLAEKQFEQKKKQLQEKTEKIGHLETALKGLKEHQKSKDDIIEELRAEIEDCSVRKKRADTLLKGLSSEKQKWIVCARMLSSKYNTVTGDVLLSAGYITLLGGFDQRFRNKVIQQWSKTLTEEGFQCNREFVFTELFGDSYKIRKWHQNKLPTDTMSVNNALIIEKTKQFCLIIDPQLQGLTWLKNQFDDAGTLTTMKQNDIQFKKQIEIAVDMGRSVIIEQIGSVIDLNLSSLIRKEVSKYGGARMIQFCRKSYKYDKNFKLFVVSSHPKPNFDVNITNHVTVLNFSVSLDSLQSQMLGLVVLNERKDLDDTFNENSKEAFDSIKSLKDIEAAILSQLDMQVQDLLGEESLIRTLAESKNTAEYVASKLKNIAQTNQFIQKSREIYSPVAYRASILFFIIQDLQKINNMYHFSLEWFKMIFVKSLELTNQLREDQNKIDENEEDGDSAQMIKNNTYSIDERIELLLKTFTQEIFKKIQMSVFEEDRSLITQTMVLRIMEHENFIDKSLCDFLLNGPKQILATTQIPQEINLIPELNNMIWANLQALANIKPFNQTNLLAHFIQNQDKWKKIIEKQDSAITWEELPNNELLDLRFFTLNDIDEIDYPDNSRQDGYEQYQGGTDAVSMTGKTIGDTNSRIGSRGNQGSLLKRSESEILRDPEIWQISDSDEFEDDGDASIKNKDDDDDQNKKDSEIEIKDENEANVQEMARYLVEQAPSFGGQKNRGNINSLKRKTVNERNLIFKREKALKSLIELCITRCLRSDLLISCLEKFAQNLVDPNYFDFKEDILEPYLQKINKAQGGKNLQVQQSSAVDQAKKILGQSKMSTSKMSGTVASQSGLDPNATAGSKMNNYGGLNETKQSGISGQQNMNIKKGAKDELDKLEKEKREKRGGMNNIKNLIREAYEDSDSKSPILFLITHSINIQDIITEFLTKKVSANSSLKPWFFSMGKGVEEAVEERLVKAAQNGDWLILENLHLVPDWLPTFEEKVSKFKGSELNQRFRIWMTCSPVKNFPSNILEKSIKVALQPPKSIKSKIERILIDQEKEAFFRKSGKNANVHKNLFFSLAYFHSILEGRIKYGVLGWNVPYKFDVSDFEVSNSQLTQVMRSTQTDQSAALEMLRYFFANINYAGKIQRVDDQITLNAIVGDLFNDQLISSELPVPADPEKSHYGYPMDNSDYFSFCDKNIPVQDSYNIFGFNYNIECNLKQKEAFSILDQMNFYNKKQNQNQDEQKEDIQLSSIKTSLRSSSQSSGSQIFQMIKNETSILSLFIALQKLLGSSSLDKNVSQSTRRYDQNIDQENLQQRDFNDIKVVEVADQLLKQLDAQFDLDLIQKKFPIRYKAPLHNIINRELTAYKLLLKAIRESVADLLANIDGKYPRPLEIEDLWSKIQENRIPKKWKAVSFQTAYDSLADFIIELGLKLEFWRKIIQADIKQIPSYWLPAFFDPKSFLSALIQTRARIDEIPMRDLRNEYEVLDIYTNSVVHPDKNVKYLHGLYLEGAHWDINKKVIVESTDLKRFIPFPAIRVRTTRSGESSGLAATPQENFANFNVNKAKKQKNKKLEQLETVANYQVEQEQKKKYKCPLYKTTLRLSTGLISQDNGPVEYFKLDTLEEPSKWTKRAVALLLETDRTDTS